jgi:predicted RNA-binding Zn-ribbon protein involved in translation (DUF1610 family)
MLVGHSSNDVGFSSSYAAHISKEDGAVAYLRTIASPQVMRRARGTCESCTQQLFSFERHCPSCGISTATFDERLFERMARSSIREALHWCEHDPKHVIEQVAIRELGDPTLRYCPVCGTHILRA